MHLYLVANPYNDNHGVIKVGYMSDRRPERIVSRYKTYYGSNTTVMCWKCSNGARLEQQFKARFVDERLELELYDARFVVRYVHWVTTTTGTAPIVCTGTFMPKHIMPNEHPTNEVISEPVCSRTRGGRLRAGPIGWRTRNRSRSRNCIR
jgi:hypothetical protein